MKTGFLFFVADHLLVGQLCTNPKSDRSLLSCLKVTQCSMSEIRDALLYKSCSLPIQVMTTGPLPAPSKCKSGLPRITGTSPEWWKQSFRLWLWSLVWFQVRATSCHLTSSKLAWKSIPKCTWMCWRVWWFPGAIRWPVADPGCGSRTWHCPQVQRDPGLASEGVLRLCTLLSLAPLLPGLNLLDYFIWSYIKNIISMTSHNTKARLITAICRVFAELPPVLVEKSCSQFWIRIEAVIELKAATLNRSQLYNIIKLPELIFSIKVLKYSCSCVFFRMTILSFHPVYWTNNLHLTIFFYNIAYLCSVYPFKI